MCKQVILKLNQSSLEKVFLFLGGNKIILVLASKSATKICVCINAVLFSFSDPVGVKSPPF